ncbi:MAG: hypothetical protein CME70_10565 [Halobacteriovorax sp.]|nr:hypothetical protein [Halobacteriovorax sp.]
MIMLAACGKEPVSRAEDSGTTAGNPNTGGTSLFSLPLPSGYELKLCVEKITIGTQEILTNKLISLSENKASLLDENIDLGNESSLKLILSNSCGTGFSAELSNTVTTITSSSTLETLFQAQGNEAPYEGIKFNISGQSLLSTQNSTALEQILVNSIGEIQ